MAEDTAGDCSDDDETDSEEMSVGHELYGCVAVVRLTVARLAVNGVLVAVTAFAPIIVHFTRPTSWQQHVHRLHLICCSSVSGVAVISIPQGRVGRDGVTDEVQVKIVRPRPKCTDCFSNG